MTFFNNAVLPTTQKDTFRLKDAANSKIPKWKEARYSSVARCRRLISQVASADYLDDDDDDDNDDGKR